MPEEGPPLDVPPAAGPFGRFRALHQLGTGSLGPVFRGEDPDTGDRVAIKHLQLKIGPERARFIAEDLRALIAQLPAHLALTRVIDAGLHEGDPYVVTSLAAGESLDIALREYGPAVLDDALPRLERLADALDLAAQAGVWHGTLHPHDIIVSARDTKISGLGVGMILERAGVRLEPRAPYAAPEAGEGPGSSALDRFAFAAIAHEWVFGKSIAGPAETPLAVPQLPGVDSDRLAGAFTTALAPLRADRYSTCAAFVAALRDATRAPRRRPGPVLPFDSEEPAGAAVLSAAAVEPIELDPPVILASSPEPDLPLETADSASLIRARDISVPAPPAPATLAAVDPDRTVRWRGSLSVADHAAAAPPPAGFSVRALVAVLLAGVAIGVIGGYVLANARRAPVNAVAQTADATAPVAPDPAAPPAAAPPGLSGKEVRDTPVPASASPAPPASSREPATHAAGNAGAAAPAARAVRREAPAAARRDTARLLVRTSPAGAAVSVDGTARGTSPIALRDLALGTRTIVVSRPGFVTAERRITLTADRPSRSVEVALAPVRPASRPAASAAGAAAGLVVESRPTGASVSIDGTRAGTTPLTVEALTPGSHRVLIEKAGYQPWSTVIAIKAGERPRVAASLVGGNER